MRHRHAAASQRRTVVRPDVEDWDNALRRFCMDLPSSRDRRPDSATRSSDQIATSSRRVCTGSAFARRPMAGRTRPPFPARTRPARGRRMTKKGDPRVALCRRGRREGAARTRTLLGQLLAAAPARHRAAPVARRPVPRPPASRSARRSVSSMSSLALRASWKAMPVPAGISRPTMTFSFRPRSSSRLPMMAASVSTRVVSWKDAAEMKRVGRQRRLGDAQQHVGVGRRQLAVRAHACRWCRAAPSAPPARRGCSRVSPGLVICTRRSIWRTITSMCLSLIFTPCRR